MIAFITNLKIDFILAKILGEKIAEGGRGVMDLSKQNLKLRRCSSRSLSPPLFLAQRRPWA